MPNLSPTPQSLIPYPYLTPNLSLTHSRISPTPSALPLHLYLFSVNLISLTHPVPYLPPSPLYPTVNPSFHFKSSLYSTFVSFPRPLLVPSPYLPTPSRFPLPVSPSAHPSPTSCLPAPSTPPTHPFPLPGPVSTPSPCNLWVRLTVSAATESDAPSSLLQPLAGRKRAVLQGHLHEMRTNQGPACVHADNAIMGEGRKEGRMLESSGQQDNSETC